MAGENEDRDELMEESGEDDDFMGSSDQSECDGDLDLEEMDFFAANQACAVHPHLKEDIKQACSAFPDAEDELGIPAVQIDETKTNLKYISAVALTFPLKDISEHLLQIWGLEDTPAVIVELDNIHRGEFRTYIHAPTIVVKKHSSEGSPFIVGEQIKNFAMMTCRELFSLRSNDSPSEVGSFFEVLYRRIKERLVRLSEFCVTCGEKLQSGGVLPSICDRELCMYQYSELHLFDGMSVPRVSPDVLSLLLFAFGNANLSYRRRDILTPNPPIKCMESLIAEAKRMRTEKVGESGDDTTKKDNDQYYYGQYGAYHRFPSTTAGASAEAATFAILLEYLPCPRVFLSSVSAYHVFREGWPLMSDIIDWLVITNRSYLEKVPKQMNVDFLHTDHQYCFVSDTPAKQAEFDQLVQQNGGKTRFFFHGSPIENWHSIIRSGLKNMSGTKYQLVGAAYGQGIYLSPNLNVSIGYASRSSGSIRRHGNMTQERTCRTDCSSAGCCETERLEDLACVALVEVVDCPSSFSMKTNEIYVVAEDKWCSIRMLLLYRTQDIANLNKAVEMAYGTGNGDQAARSLMRKAASSARRAAASAAAGQSSSSSGGSGAISSAISTMLGTVQNFMSLSSSSSTMTSSQQPPAAPPSSPQPTEHEKTKEKLLERIAEIKKNKALLEEKRKQLKAAMQAPPHVPTPPTTTAAKNAAAAVTAALAAGYALSGSSESTTSTTPSDSSSPLEVITVDDVDMKEGGPGTSGLQDEMEKEMEEIRKETKIEEAGASSSSLSVKEQEDDWMEVKKKEKKEKKKEREERNKEKTEKRKSDEMEEGAGESAQVRRAKAAKEKSEKDAAKRKRSGSWSMGEEKKKEKDEREELNELLEEGGEEAEERINKKIGEIIEEADQKEKESATKNSNDLTDEDFMMIAMFDDVNGLEEKEKEDDEVEVLKVKPGKKKRECKEKKEKKKEEGEPIILKIKKSTKESKDKEKKKKRISFEKEYKEMQEKMKEIMEGNEKGGGSSGDTSTQSSVGAATAATAPAGSSYAQTTAEITSMVQQQQQMLQMLGQQLQQMRQTSSMLAPLPTGIPPGQAIPPGLSMSASSFMFGRLGRGFRSSLNGVKMPGDLSSLTDEQRDQIYRVVHMFRNSGFEDRLNRHMNRDGEEKKEEEEGGEMENDQDDEDYGASGDGPDM